MHYNEIKDKFYFYNAGQAGRITYYMDKNNINVLAQKYGLNVAKTFVVNCGEVPEKIEYPVITKAISSNSGGWKDDVFICHSEQELVDAYTKIKSPVVLLQKYVRKKNELCLDGFAADHGRKVFISIASSYNYVLPNTYSSYMTVRNFDDVTLQRRLSAMFEEIGFEGIFSVEFLVGEGNELYFLEINFRNSTWSYASTCAGMNLPKLWAESMLTGQISKRNYREIPAGFTAMAEISDFKDRVLTCKIGLIEWIRQVKKCNCTFYYNKVDSAPFWSALFGKISSISRIRKGF